MYQRNFRNLREKNPLKISTVNVVEAHFIIQALQDDIWFILIIHLKAVDSKCAWI